MSANVQSTKTNRDGELGSALPTRYAQKLPRLWPPPPYQSYCKVHFIEECSVYYVLENAKFEKIKATIQETHPPKPNVEKRPGTPTRIQPSRAKKRVVNTPNKADLELQDGRSKKISVAAQKEIGKLEKRRTKLRLDLSCANFTKKLEKRIAHTNDTISIRRKAEKREKPGSSSNSNVGPVNHTKEVDPHPKCPFSPWTTMGCRYCDFNSQTTQIIASVAPMHLIRRGDFIPEQYGEFGGLRFAVDICTGEEKVILASMMGLDGPFDELKKHPGNKGKVVKEKPTGQLFKSAPLRKRNQSPTTGKVEDDNDTVMPGKRKRIVSSLDNEDLMAQVKPTREQNQTTATQRKHGEISPSLTTTDGLEEGDDDDIVTRKRRKVRVYRG